MAKLPIFLDVYVEPGRGRDLSLRKGGSEGFRKAVEGFTASLSSYDRRCLQLEEKVVIVGDTQVGKSCLLERFIYGSFTDRSESTIGLDFQKQHYTCGGLDFTLCIWDTAGQERFRSVSNHFYRGAQACIAAFDLGVPMTLSHVKQSDMYHTVSDTHAQHVASELQAEYFEVSAKTGINVKTLFNRVACVLFERTLLKQTEEWKQQSKNETIKLRPAERIVEEVLLGDPGAGKGTENWKEVKDSQRNLRCCGAS